jgi:hypothetical protein
MNDFVHLLVLYYYSLNYFNLKLNGSLSLTPSRNRMYNYFTDCS